MKMNRTDVSQNKSFQFIVLPNTGFQICRDFPLSKEIELKPNELWELAEKTAQDYKNDETVKVFSEHIAVNRNINATGWIPCNKNEFVFFRLTRPGNDIYLDLAIDTKVGAGKVFKNQIHCILEKGLPLFKKKYSLANFFIEEHKEAHGVRGSLLIDYGNTGISAMFSPTGKGPLKDTIVTVNEPFDLDYKSRTDDERRIIKSSLALLKVPSNPRIEPWTVMGKRAEDLIKLEPLCTYVFAPKKYVRFWPGRLKALEPSIQYRGIIGQKSGLYPMLTFVQLGIEHLINTVIAGLTNPEFTSHKPEIYPIIERIILTYPLTWRESDKEVFEALFRVAVSKYLIVDRNINPEVDIELICSEPVAVAAYLIWESVFHYGLDALKLMNSTLGNLSGDSHLRLLILDIGGGATDIAVVEIQWEVSKKGGVDVMFQMVESMKFNRAGDRLTHIIVTSLFDYMRHKYDIAEELDFTKLPVTYADFSINYKRNAVSKLNELAESAKEFLSQNDDLWKLDKDEEYALLNCFEPVVRDKLSEEAVEKAPHYELSNEVFEQWIRNDRQSEDTNGEPGFMDIFLFLKDLRQSLEQNERMPHAVVLSGRTTRLPIIKKLVIEHINMPFHKVRTLPELLPITANRPGHESSDKISVVCGAHRFRFGDNVRFIPLPEEKIFNRYIGTVFETPDGLKLNETFCKPGETPPHSVSIEVYPGTDLRIGHCFREEGIAEVIAVLSNKSATERKTAVIDIVDDFTVRLNKGNDIILAEWVPGGNDIIVDNFNDTGKIDANPPGFILNKVISDTNRIYRGNGYEE
ncbi:MAG: hypothetical protein GY795_28540 [Desulfobacterales bacterium]|nr:hypothetical protein [Desulfobacterales bacterium]